MIEKVITIRGIGLLKEAFPSGAQPFKKINLVYAENGRGKSTFSTILRSLSTGDANLILSKKTLGERCEPEAQILISGHCYRFRKGQWNKSYSKILIFDDHFVENNVYSGSRVEAVHRENLLEFVLGEKGVLLKKDIDRITEEIENINKELRRLEQEIIKYSTPYQVEEFVNLPPSADVDFKLEQVTKKFNDTQNVIALKYRPLWSDVVLPGFDLNDIEKLLMSSLDDVVQEAERQVKAHVCRLGDGAEDWIRQGLKYLGTINNCPFCNQNLNKVDLIEAYKSYFNISYESLKRRITEKLKEIEENFSEKKWFQILETLRNNKNAEVAWNDHPDLSFPRLPEESKLSSVWTTLLDATLSCIKMKAGDPLAVLEIPNDLRVAYEKYKMVCKEIEDYNNKVMKINSEINSLIKSLLLVNPSELQKEINRLQAEKRRLQPEIDIICKTYLDLQKQKNELDKEKSHKREQLNQYTKEIIRQYKEAINELLKRFGAGFSIEAFSVKHIRGIPRTEYALRVMREPVPLTSQSEENSPNFSNTLSSGDKRTLALAFFLARVKLESELHDHVIIVDDPVSSFDAGRRHATRNILIELSQNCSQLIILSHDATFLRDFLRDIEKDNNDDIYQTLQIIRSGEYSIFDKGDIYRICQEEYYKVYERLIHYLKEGPSGNECQIAGDIRVYLEYNLRFRFPVELEDLDTLGKMINRIRQSPDEFLPVSKRLKDLEELNDFSSPFHHGAGDRPGKLTDAELRPKVELALEIGRG